MRIKDKNEPTFKSGGFYNLTAQVQENTILNRGLIDIGGASAQVIMSNNKDEKIERGVMSCIYFVESFMAPFVLLPFFNKKFLARNEIVKNFNNNERKIIEVSKKYLTKNTKYMVEGIRETAKQTEAEAAKRGNKINVTQDFEAILIRFEGKEQLLKDKLIKTHENVLFADFLATACMWCSTPWTAMEITKLRTNRSGFSATYEMMNEEQSKSNTQKYEQEKKKKLLYSAAAAIVPSIIFPKLVSKGLKDKSGILSSIVKKYPEHFNYTKGMFPSKAIFAAIWLFCDYPTKLISSRDKYERRDRAIREMANLLVFFGGDFIFNNVLGQLSDKYLKTQIMDRSKLKPNAGFFKKLLLSPKNFVELEDSVKISENILKRSKNVGAGLYWATLAANMLFLGFGVPKILNKMLKKSVKEDLTKKNNTNQVP